MELDLSARYVRLAFNLIAPAPHETHPNLDCIRIEPHEQGVVIVATDAAWMFVGIDENGFTDQAVNLNVTVLAHSKMRQPGSRLLFTRKKGLRVMRGSTCLYRQEEPAIAKDDRYPDWRKAVSNYTRDLSLGVPAVMGTPYIRKVARMLDDVPELTQAAFLGAGTYGAAAILHFPEDPSIMLIGMPLKGEFKKPEQSWALNFCKDAPETDDDL
jgi:hypothetical protein